MLAALFGLDIYGSLSITQKEVSLSETVRLLLCPTFRNLLRVSAYYSPAHSLQIACGKS